MRTTVLIVYPSQGACAGLSARENELLQYSLLLSVSAKKVRSFTVRFGSRGLNVVGLRKQPPSFCAFNFGSKEQRYKKKDRILIKDVISYKLKYRTKEAWLILQSGGATIGTWFPRDRRRLRNERKQRGNSILMNVTTQIWVILLTGPTV